jgi:hypothetical protein
MRLNRALGAASLAAATVALSACSFLSPQTTEKPYNPADGVAAEIGDVSARNLAIVAEAKGGPGALTGAVVNTGSGIARVSFAPKEGTAPSTTIPVGSRAVVEIKDVTFASVPSAPGTITDIYIITEKDGKQLVSVPIVSAEGVYKNLAPKK